MQAPSVLLMVVAFVLLLAPLVVVHELGHYLVGRWCGIGADVFSVGFGRELIGWTDRRGTRWRLSLVPLGGYVKFAGDMNAASVPNPDADAMPPEERAAAFQFKPLWQRALVVAAGPVTNFLVAVAIFAAFNFAYGRIEASSEIAGFATPSPAQAAGLRVGDRITAIDGKAVASFDDIRMAVVPFPGENLRITARRGRQDLNFGVPVATHIDHDQFGHDERIGMIGIAGGKGEIVHYGPIASVRLAGDQCLSLMGMMATGIRQIITGSRSVNELSGPIRIAQYSGAALAMGWQTFVGFAAFISINLAFINLLPIPALDGGHLVFYAVEAVRRRPLARRTQEMAFMIGLALVLGLALFITLGEALPQHMFGG